MKFNTFTLRTLIFL